jgi:hypothetical protein
VLSSIIVSETLLFVVLTVVVVPLTVKLPVIVNAPPIVTLSGKAMFILLSDTVVAISFAVPSNVNVFVPTVTVSFDPLSAAIVNVLAELVSESTYAFVAASCALLGSATFVSALVLKSTVCPDATSNVPPTNSCLAIPTPPSITAAPVVILEDTVVASMFNCPEPVIAAPAIAPALKPAKLLRVMFPAVSPSSAPTLATTNVSVDSSQPIN